ncbi:MAG: hypothetical protein QGH59_06395, partial [Gemmatimonadota bacterium]|nr:hypothetical protein [Gemmatimonadota bacterium]
MARISTRTFVAVFALCGQLTLSLAASAAPPRGESAVEPPWADRPPTACEVRYPGGVPRMGHASNLWPDGVVPYDFDAGISS